MSTTFGIEMVWKSALILSGAALTALALRRSTAATRHLVWSLGTAGSLALPVLALAVPAWTWAVIPATGHRSLAPVRRANLTPVVSLPHSIPPRVRDRPSERDPDEVVKRVGGAEEGVRTSVVSNGTGVGSTSRWISRSPTVWILGVWSIVAGLMLALRLISRVGLRRLVRDARPLEEREWEALLKNVITQLGVRRRVTLLRSGSGLMPMTWGWLRPIILLPAEADTWTPGRRRDVLLHEMAHVRRFDCLTQTIAQLACAFYWFNPLAWLASFHMRVERERACDDMVLDAGARPSDYALFLLEMSRRLQSGGSADVAAVAMARPSSLEGRLVAILDPKLRRGRLSRSAAALALIVLVAVVGPLCALRLKAQPAETDRGGIAVNPPKSRSDRTMTVTGTVLDPDGKPVKNAVVDLLGHPGDVWVGASVDERGCAILSQGETDGDGRFRLETPRTSSAPVFNVLVLAGSKGYGFGCAYLKPDAEQPDAQIRLRPEQPVRVSLVDVTGMPASGVEVRVQGVMPEIGRDQNEEVYLPGVPPEGLRAWPGKTTTDDQGQFILNGIGADINVHVRIADIRFACQTPVVKLGSQGTLQETAIALEPARIIEGRVLAADTGKPIPNAMIAAAARIPNHHANGDFTTKFRADSEGRFRINPLSNDEYTLNAFPPAVSRDMKLGREIATRSWTVPCSVVTYFLVAAKLVTRSRLISGAACRLSCRPSASAITHS